MIRLRAKAVEHRIPNEQAAEMNLAGRDDAFELCCALRVQE